MYFLDLTLPTPEENLACDEALWELCEAGGPEGLRCWESPVPFVVLGYSNRVATEVNLEACERRGIPVLRRITGGGTVVQGPGCLNYSLILRVHEHGPTASISATNLHIMNRHAALLTGLLGLPVRRRGATDLAIDDRKISGNAQRRGREALLFHGTFLRSVDADLLEALLPLPSREPDYRHGRPHRDFVRGVEFDAAALKDRLGQAWNVDRTPPELPARRIRELVQRKGVGPIIEESRHPSCVPQTDSSIIGPTPL